MSEEEKFVIKTLKDSQNAYIENTKVKKVELSTNEAKVVLNLIQRQQKELKKKDKIINLMAEHIEKNCDFDNRIQTKQQILEYFKNNLEEDIKE